MTDDWAAPRQGDGIRRNALSAPHWVPLGEIDPRVADALLETLEDAGVAAYAQQDRLYVDGSRRDVAEAVVAAELPGLVGELEPAGLEAPVDETAAFDAIVARWDTEPETPVPPWPVHEDTGSSHSVPVTLPAEPEEPASWSPEPYDEGHYVPPPPPPVPEADPVNRWAAISIGIGLLIIVGLPLLSTTPSFGAQVLGTLLVIGGIGTLVWRMRDAPPTDDGPDDGAVV